MNNKKHNKILFSKAKDYFNSRDYASSATCLIDYLGKFPDDIKGIILLGRVLSGMHYYNKAEEAFNVALKNDQNNFSARFYLGALWIRMGHYSKAEKLYRQLLKTKHEDSLPLIINLVQALGRQGKYDEVQEWLLMPIVTSSKDPFFIVARAEMCLIRGEFENAYLLVKKIKISDPEVILESDIDEQKKLNDAYISVLFIRANYHHHYGEYDKSFLLYNAAHSVQKSIYGCYDFPSMERNLKSDIKIYENIKPKLLKFEKLDYTPVFIVGMPRSGTSLLHQMLDMHTQIVGLGELSEIPEIATKIRSSEFIESDSYESTYILRKAYIDYCASLVNDFCFQVMIDKLPHNFLYIGTIMLLFPESKIIFCERDALDNCLSIYQQNMTGDHSYSHDFDQLARFYCFSQYALEQWKLLFEKNILIVRYEEMVKSSEKKLRCVLDFLGLPYEDSCLNVHLNKNIINTSSRHQVQQPIYDSSINKWQKYSGNLGNLKENIDRYKEFYLTFYE